MSTRIEMVQSELKKRDENGLLVSSAADIFYVTGSGREGFGDPMGMEREAWMVILERAVYFFTDSRYESLQLKKQLHKLGVEFRLISHERSFSKQLEKVCQEHAVGRLTFEPSNVSVAEYEKLEKFLKKPKKKRISIVSELRSVKEASEIKLIRHTCRLVDDLMTYVISHITVGQTERDIFDMLLLGGEMAFPPIVAIDENSAIPHYNTKAGGDKKVKKGSLILIDCGIRYKNYCSDLTRIVAMGYLTPEVKRAYAALQTAQQKTIENLSRFKTYKEVDQACRNSLSDANYAPYSHATGHGIGIQVHELPRFSPVSTDTIKPGAVVTVEPGIYIPGKWGMRLEDTVLINSDGSATALTKSSRELLVI